jgi:hypothetical protein
MTELTLKTTLDELDASMLENLRNFFMGDAIVHIRISNIPDETTFLLSTQANRESLERSLEQFQQSEFIAKTQQELEELEA